ncbi:MAG: type II secretion system protein [Planctomycetota bacterium]
MKKQAFTLIELIIVVSILGILAAIVIPQVQGNTVQAKESAAKSSLHTLRAQIGMYKLEHDNPPGYLSGTASTNTTFFTNQLAGISNTAGVSNSATSANATYPYGPYVSDIPKNPFNNLSTIKIFTTDTAFSAEANDNTGWLYKTLTGEIRLNTTTSDSSGANYTDY